MELALGSLFLLCALLAGLYYRQNRTLQRALSLNAQMTEALDHVNAYIFIKDQDGRYLYANKLCLDKFGIRSDQLFGRDDTDFFPADAAIRLRKIDQAVIETQQHSLKEVEISNGDGTSTLYLESKYPIPPQPGQPRSLVGVSTDITELWTLRTQLEKQAWHDDLTGLYNRRKLNQAFRQRLTQEPASAGPTSLILMDLDHFKQVNDHHGHAVGDRVLQEIASILLQHCPERAVCGRWGGEEFLIIYPGDKAGATRFAEQLGCAIRSHHYGTEQPVTASFGITCSDEADTEHTLLIKADHALYEAKHSGRDRICVADDTQVPVN